MSITKSFTFQPSVCITPTIWYHCSHLDTLYLTYLMASLASFGALRFKYLILIIFILSSNKSHTVLHGLFLHPVTQGPLPQFCWSLGLVAALQNTSSTVILSRLRSVQTTVRNCTPKRQFSEHYT